LSTAARCSARIGKFWSRDPAMGCPVRSAMSTAFTSLSVQRIHSNSVFAQPFLIRAARTSWSVNLVPSSRSAISSNSIL